MPPTLTAFARSLLRASPPAVPAAARLANHLTAAAFLLFLTGPLAGSLLRPASQPMNEKRPLSPVPHFPNVRWKAQAFPFMFDAYFKDRTGYRGELLAVRQHLLVETLSDSISDRVWIGRDGWLFVNCVGPAGLVAVPPDAEPRVRQWAEALEERRQWLAARGIRYVVLVAPEKSSVYPEYLPPKIRRHPPPDNVARLKDRMPNVPLVDPLPAILRGKGAGPVYHRTDSHWNDSGAFMAYLELGQALRHACPDYRGKTVAEYKLLPWIVNYCDLSLSLGRPVEACVEDFVSFREPEGTTTFPPVEQLAPHLENFPDRLKHLAPVLAESGRGTGRAVLLHDSFGTALQRLLASDFRRLTSVGTYGLPTAVIEAEKPDVVIQVLVARALTFERPPRLAKIAP